MARQPCFRIGPIERALHVRREQRRLLVGAEESDRVEIPSLLVAADVAEKILPACAVRQTSSGEAGDAPQCPRTVSIECEHPWMRQVPVVSAEQLVAAVAREYDRDVPPGHFRDVPRR